MQVLCTYHRSWVVALGRDCSAGFWGHVYPTQRIVQQVSRVLSGFCLLSLLVLATGEEGEAEEGLRAQFLWLVHDSQVLTNSHHNKLDNSLTMFFLTHHSQRPCRKTVDRSRATCYPGVPQISQGRTYTFATPRSSAVSSSCPQRPRT